MADLICDQPCADVNYILLRLKIVLVKRFARFNYIDDNVRKLKYGGKLNRAVELDYIYFSALLIVIFSCYIRELRRNSQRSVASVAKVLFCGNCHSALAHSEIEQLVNVGLVLKDYILARNSDIRRTSLDVYYHVRGLYPEVSHADLGVFKYKLSALLADRRTFKSRFFKYSVSLLAKSALGERYVNHLFQV